ncbi:MAG: hypothetical protein ACP5JO_05690 [Candidatus Ratteibacteria bacterium]
MNTKLFQEKVYGFNKKNNGAGPLWCLGSSCIAAIKDRVFICGWETWKIFLHLIVQDGLYLKKKNMAGI